jgi:hypothetical protein
VVIEMSETKTKSNTENILKEDFTKHNGLEMMIVPKNHFLEWFIKKTPIFS